MRARLFRTEGVSRLRMQALALLGFVIFFGGLASLLYYSFLPYAGFEFVGVARIGAVVPDSPAEAAGLEVGDEVLAMDGVPFRLGMVYLQPGQETLDFTVSREGQIVTVKIALTSPSWTERSLSGASSNCTIRDSMCRPFTSGARLQ